MSTVSTDPTSGTTRVDETAFRRSRSSALLAPAPPLCGLTLPQDLQNRNTFSSHMQTGLEGARVLVTGGSGGIGAACVRLFAAEGARVVVHYHRGRERAEAAGGATVVAADL